MVWITNSTDRKRMAGWSWSKGRSGNGPKASRFCLVKYDYYILINFPNLAFEMGMCMVEKVTGCLFLSKYTEQMDGLGQSIWHCVPHFMACLSFRFLRLVKTYPTLLTYSDSTNTHFSCYFILLPRGYLMLTLHPFDTFYMFLNILLK